MESKDMKKQAILIGEAFCKASINLMMLQDNVSTICVAAVRNRPLA